MEHQFKDIPKFVFGAMWLGMDYRNAERDYNTARYAMQNVPWFHASQEYGQQGGCFWILRQAFDAHPEERPKLILKVRCDTPEYIRHDVYQALYQLNIPRIDVVQLCSWNFFERDIADDFFRKGPKYKVCEELKERGLVDHFLMEIFPGVSDQAAVAVENDLFDGFIFFLNTLDRYVDGAVFDAMVEKKRPVFAMRPFAKAAPFFDSSHVLAPHVEQLRPAYEESGADNWLQFNMNYIFSHPNVVTTVGGTSNPDHLDDYLRAVEKVRPLSQEICLKINDVQASVPVDMPTELPYHV
jgi:aryl-alcohol dehydrogenase-like predicted oxidoreductase